MGQQRINQDLRMGLNRGSRKMHYSVHKTKAGKLITVPKRRLNVLLHSDPWQLDIWESRNEDGAGIVSECTPKRRCGQARDANKLLNSQ